MGLVTPAQNMSDHIFSLLLTHVKYYSERKIDHVPLSNKTRETLIFFINKRRTRIFTFMVKYDLFTDDTYTTQILIRV